ncbi:MAG: 50S ribosomal protein L3 [Oligoflexia bacterium]|nr:MAG: 50S ribosomal protein L3 [Oligoflexia bacterium]
MSEKETQATDAAASSGEIKLNGLYAFKAGMATVYNDQGEAVPVTVLRYEPWVVSQIKTTESDGYSALQLACGPKKAKNSTDAEKGHFSKAGFENGVKFVKELRQEIPGDAKLGSRVSINSLQKGDVVKITGRSKGHGFAGSVKRWSFAGGPASHGSKFHRKPGSSGNRTWPGRVMPGKKFPGHYGDETITVKNVVVVDVVPQEGVLMVKGPVPGARNSLVRLVKEV